VRIQHESNNTAQHNLLQKPIGAMATFNRCFFFKNQWALLDIFGIFRCSLVSSSGV